MWILLFFSCNWCFRWYWKSICHSGINVDTLGLCSINNYTFMIINDLQQHCCIGRWITMWGKMADFWKCYWFEKMTFLTICWAVTNKINFICKERSSPMKRKSGKAASWFMMFHIYLFCLDVLLITHWSWICCINFIHINFCSLQSQEWMWCWWAGHQKNYKMLQMK